MTNKEIVELLCELVDLKELTNRGLILKDINNFQRQLEKDLEVLEILKNKKVNILELKKYPNPLQYNVWSDGEYLTRDDFNKIKEWLDNE